MVNVFLLSSFLLLNSCSLLKDYFKRNDQEDITFSIDLKNRFPPKELKKIKNVLVYIQKKDYRTASKKINSMLKHDPRNGFFHFINGFVYHNIAITEDRSYLSYAIEGYRSALRNGPFNPWYSYFLGLTYFGEREYQKATEQFKIVSKDLDKNYEVFSYLARSAYLSGNPELAKKSIEKSLQIAPQNEQIKLLRDQIIILASLGEFFKSYKLTKDFSLLMKKNKLNNDFSNNSLSFVENRIQRWKRTFQSGTKLAQYSFGSSGGGGSILGSENTTEGLGPGSYSSGGSSSRGLSSVGSSKNTKKDAPKMVMVDVTIIRSEERKAISNGVNLLNGLNLQFTSTPYSQNSDRTTGSPKTQSVTQSFQLSIPQVNYNINIFNDAYDRNEILARPTILATEGKTSTFFSGSVLHVAISPSDGQGQASLDSIPVGIQLIVTPTFLRGKKILLEVDAARAFIENRSDSSSFNNFTQTSKTHVNSKVVLKYGETAILSGLSEHSEGKVIDRVPLLGQIPFIKSFFSSEEFETIHRSILILLTPRKVKPNITVKDQKTKLAPLMRSGKFYSPIKRRAAIQKIASDLKNSDAYRSFRMGDMNSIGWNNADSLGRWLIELISIY